MKIATAVRSHGAEDDPVSANVFEASVIPPVGQDCDACVDHDSVTIATTVTAGTATNLGVVDFQHDSTPEDDETFTYYLVFTPKIASDSTLDAYLATRGIAKTGHTIVVRGKTLTNQTITSITIGSDSFAALGAQYTIPANDLVTIKFRWLTDDNAAVGAPATGSTAFRVAEDDSFGFTLNVSRLVSIADAKLGPAKISYPAGGATAADVSVTGAEAVAPVIWGDTFNNPFAFSGTKNRISLTDDTIVEADETFTYLLQVGVDVSATAKAAATGKRGTEATNAIIAAHLQSIGLATTGHKSNHDSTTNIDAKFTLSANKNKVFYSQDFIIEDNDGGAQITLTLPAGNEGNTVVPTVAFSTALKASIGMQQHLVTSTPVSATVASGANLAAIADPASRTECDACYKSGEQITIAASGVANTATNMGTGFIIKNDNAPEGVETFIYHALFLISITSDTTTTLDAYLAKRGIAKTGHTVVVAGQTLTNQTITTVVVGSSTYATLKATYTIPENDLATLWFQFEDVGSNAFGAPTTTGGPFGVAKSSSQNFVYMRLDSTKHGGKGLPPAGATLGPVSVRHITTQAADVSVSSPRAFLSSEYWTTRGYRGGNLSAGRSNRVTIAGSSVAEAAETFAYRLQIGGAVADKSGTTDEIIAKHLKSIGVSPTGHKSSYDKGTTYVDAKIVLDADKSKVYFEQKFEIESTPPDGPQITLKVREAVSALGLSAGNKRTINNFNSNYDVVVNEPAADAAFIVEANFTAALTSTSGAVLEIKQTAVSGNADISAPAAGVGMNATNPSATSGTNFSITVKADDIAEGEESHQVSYTVAGKSGLTLSSIIPTTFTVTVKIRPSDLQAIHFSFSPTFGGPVRGILAHDQATGALRIQEKVGGMDIFTRGVTAAGAQRLPSATATLGPLSILHGTTSAADVAITNPSTRTRAEWQSSAGTTAKLPLSNSSRNTHTIVSDTTPESDEKYTLLVQVGGTITNKAGSNAEILERHLHSIGISVSGHEVVHGVLQSNGSSLSVKRTWSITLSEDKSKAHLAIPFIIVDDDRPAQMTLTIPAGEEGDTITPTVAFSQALKANTNFYTQPIASDPASAIHKTARGTTAVQALTGCDVCMDDSNKTVATTVAANTATNLGIMILKDDATPEEDETFIYEFSFASNSVSTSTTHVDAFLAARGIAKGGHTVVVAGKTLTNQSFIVRDTGGQGTVYMQVEYTIPENDQPARITLTLPAKNEGQSFVPTVAFSTKPKTAVNFYTTAQPLATVSATTANLGSASFGGQTCDACAVYLPVVTIPTSTAAGTAVNVGSVLLRQDNASEGQEKFYYDLNFDPEVTSSGTPTENQIATFLAARGIARDGHTIIVRGATLTNQRLTLRGRALVLRAEYAIPAN